MQCLYDSGDENKIPSTYDGAVYDIAVGSDCVCGGVGDEFAISYTPNSLGVSFQAGSEAIIGGAFVKCDETTTVTLQSNSTIYLCLRIDKTQPNGSRSMFYQNTEQGIQKQNLNGNGTVRDLLLYKIITSASGVTSVEDKKVIRTSQSTQVGGLTLWTGTQSEYDAIDTKDNNTLYFIEAEQQ